jgi:hypothetical protein
MRVNATQNGEHSFLVECQMCQGTGVAEELRCKDASSECCGGCLYDVDCSDCNAQGYIQEDCFNYQDVCTDCLKEKNA